MSQIERSRLLTHTTNLAQGCYSSEKHRCRGPSQRSGFRPSTSLGTGSADSYPIAQNQARWGPGSSRVAHAGKTARFVEARHLINNRHPGRKAAADWDANW